MLLFQISSGWRLFSCYNLLKTTGDFYLYIDKTMLYFFVLYSSRYMYSELNYRPQFLLRKILEFQYQNTFFFFFYPIFFLLKKKGNGSFYNKLFNWIKQDKQNF